MKFSTIWQKYIKIDIVVENETLLTISDSLLPNLCNL